MKVAELKLVVDANAAEMREGFGKVSEEFEKVREEFGRVHEEMRTEFAKVREETRNGFANVREEMAAIRKEVQDTAKETRHHMDMFFEDAVHKAATIIEARIDEKIDLRVATS